MNPNLKSSGQIIIVLLLLTLVALSVGLAITQRTITSVTTSTQGEQSSRAFSAAEAGIEKASQTCSPGQMNCSSIPNISLANNASADVSLSPPIPFPEQALEYPPLGKEEIAQFWFAVPSTLEPFYTANSFSLYFGNPNAYTSNDAPAIEVNVITFDGTNYISNRYFYDSVPSRIGQNGFRFANCNNLFTIPSANINNYPTSQFVCKASVPCTGCAVYTGTPVLARVRVLYSRTKQKVAVQPNIGLSLPPQATIYTSTGNSGQSQQTISVFKSANTVPFLFDYAVFSSGDLIKQ